jgi:hypothetical protein
MGTGIDQGSLGSKKKKNLAFKIIQKGSEIKM